MTNTPGAESNRTLRYREQAKFTVKWEGSPVRQARFNDTTTPCNSKKNSMFEVFICFIQLNVFGIKYKLLLSCILIHFLSLH